MAFFKDSSVTQDVMLADLDILSPEDHCRVAHARQYARHAASVAAAAPYAMIRAHWSSTLNCPLRMHRTTWEPLSGVACTLGTLGAGTPARAMRQCCRTASAAPLHQHAQCKTWWTRQPTPRANASGSVLRHSHAGVCGSRRTGCMVGLVHRRTMHSPCGLLMSVTPQHGNTSGALQSGRCTLQLTLDIT